MRWRLRRPRAQSADDRSAGTEKHVGKTFSDHFADMGREESLETHINLFGRRLLNAEMPRVMQRPFRSRTIRFSGIALVGGGRIPKPGEVSLAHNGVLFLDEFAEFQVLRWKACVSPWRTDVLRLPGENASVTYPLRLCCIASMNPCPCGYYNDPEHTCHCTQAASTVIFRKFRARFWTESTSSCR